MPEINRRQALSGIATLAIGGAGVYTLTDESKGTQVSVDSLSVPDNSTELVDPLNTLTIAVSGSYQLESDVKPTKVILRLEGKNATASDYTQITATDYSSDLAKQMTKDFSLNGNILTLPNVDAPSLSPQEVGNSKSLTIDFRLKLIVRSDGEVVDSHSVEESSTVEITKAEPGMEATVDATGNITASD